MESEGWMRESLPHLGRVSRYHAGMQPADKSLPKVERHLVVGVEMSSKQREQYSPSGTASTIPPILLVSCPIVRLWMTTNLLKDYGPSFLLCLQQKPQKIKPSSATKLDVACLWMNFGSFEFFIYGLQFCPCQANQKNEET